MEVVKICVQELVRIVMVLRDFGFGGSNKKQQLISAPVYNIKEYSSYMCGPQVTIHLIK